MACLQDQQEFWKYLLQHWNMTSKLLFFSIVFLRKTDEYLIMREPKISKSNKNLKNPSLSLMKSDEIRKWFHIITLWSIEILNANRMIFFINIMQGRYRSANALWKVIHPLLHFWVNLICIIIQLKLYTYYLKSSSVLHFNSKRVCKNLSCFWWFEENF